MFPSSLPSTNSSVWNPSHYTLDSLIPSSLQGAHLLAILLPHLFVLRVKNGCGLILYLWLQNQVGPNFCKKNHTICPLSVPCPTPLESYFALSHLTLNTISPSILTFSWWSSFSTAENTDTPTFQAPTTCLPTFILYPLFSCWLSSLCVYLSPLLVLCIPSPLSYSILSLLNHPFPLSTESFPLTCRHAVIFLT